MENYRYSHFDGFGNLKQRTDIANVNAEHGYESSNLYGVPLRSSTITQEDGTIHLPDTMCNQSGRCQYDDNVYPDFRPFTAAYTDNTGFLDYYLHSPKGLIHPARAADYTGDSSQGSCRLGNAQGVASYSPKNMDFGPFTAAYTDNTGFLDYYLHSPKGLIHPARAADYTGDSPQGSCRLGNAQGVASYRPKNLDFRPFTAAYTDNTGFLDYYLHSPKGLIHPARAADYTGDSPQGSYRLGNAQGVLSNSNSNILYVNNPDTGELKSYQVLTEKRLHPVHPNRETTENFGTIPDGSEQPLVLRDFLPLAATPHFTVHNMDSRTVSAVINDLPSGSDMEGALKLTLPGSVLDRKSKKTCSCSKTKCLKLYCECFANGEFCNNCNCSDCYNNIYHQFERCKAIKAYLDRNPEAFQPKIGKLKTGDIKPRHTKGCNCKRSGCLKNYCQCYEAKIMCSSMCKCLTCKNYEESPDRKYCRNKQQYADTESIIRTCTSIEVVKAACACLLARAEVAERENYSTCFAERMIIEEFGKCLEQMLQKDLD